MVTDHGYVPATALSSISHVPTSFSPTVSDLLHDLESQFDQVAALYDNKFSEACQAMDDSSTIHEYIVAQRRDRTMKCAQDLNHARQCSQLVEAEAGANNAMKNLLVGLDTVEEKKQRLILAIDEMEASICRLQVESNKDKDALSALSRKNAYLQSQWADAQPTLKFIKRLLKGVSNMSVHTKSESTVHGFIGSDDGKNVFPFSISATDPSYEEVKAVWDIINAQVEQELISHKALK